MDTVIAEEDKVKYFNESYFNLLKNETNGYDENNNPVLRYPHIENLQINNNSIIHNGNSLNLGSFELNLIDESLFTFPTDEILTYLFYFTQVTNKPELIKQELVYLNYIQNLPNLDNDQKNYLTTFLNDYLNRKKYNNKYHLEIFNDDFLTRQNVINESFNESNPNYTKEANSKIREFIINEADKFADLGGNSKNNVRVRKNGLNVIDLEGTYKDYDALEKMAGFANTTILVSITVMIGIVLAILAIWLS